MTGGGLPPSHPAVTHETALALLRSQHPDLAHLPLGARHDGWDMAMFRLGGDLALRLPRTENGALALQAESFLIALLGGAWTFPFPRHVRQGTPGHGYPWQWGVVTWLNGDLAAEAPLNVDAGEAIGEALAQIHQPAPAHGRRDLEHSGNLAAREAATMARIAALENATGPAGERLDGDLAQTLWAAAMHAADPGEWVWSHADLHGFNVLSDGGRFAGIIDWGDIGACDPAVDLGFFFTLLPAAGVERGWARYTALTGRDGDALWARARGIGLWKCADLALWDRPTVSATGWHGFVALGVAQ